MTTEERFERIEHVTAGLAEQQKRDREENRQLWRETQTQLHGLTLTVHDLGVNLNNAVDGLSNQLGEFIQEAGASDRALGQRIDSLISAIGKLVAGIQEMKEGRK